MKFKIGDRVVSTVNLIDCGIKLEAGTTGEIEVIEENLQFPIYVLFDDGTHDSFPVLEDEIRLAE